MDKVIDSQFLRVEKALSTLISSIATYNPSPQLATDLVVADEELSKGLELLAKHQANHARILSLRATVSNLDDQIGSTLKLLVDVRAELLATPATIFPDDANPVLYSELLSYARRISKFTVPPTFRETDVDGIRAEPANANGSPDTEVKGETQVEVHDVRTNGTTTPVVTNGVIGGLNSGDAGTGTPIEAAENPTALPPALSEWLNPHNGIPPFVPWPTEETIRRGALASIQILRDQGIDPATFDPERSAELEAERKRLELEAETRRAEQEVERMRMEEERREEMRRRQSVSNSTTSKPEEKPAVYTGLDIFDDIDEEDD